MMAWQEPEDDVVETALLYLEIGREAFEPRKRAVSASKARESSFYVELGIMICLASAGGMVWVIGKMFGEW